MRMRHLGAVVASLTVAAAATFGSAVLAAGPADAATATQAKLAIDTGKHKVQQVTGQYGNLVGFLEGSITDGSGTPVDGGEADLQAKLPGKGWKTVKKDSDASFLSFGTFGDKAKGNIAYRVRYLGDATFAPTTSNVVTVTTLWSLKDHTDCVGGCHIRGQLVPRTKHHKITVQVKRGGWKKFKVVHTDAKGKFSVHVTVHGKKTLYRIIVAGTRSITATKFGYVATSGR
jgi:hypothetical protein